jgi:hypothetical protein
LAGRRVSDVQGEGQSTDRVGNGRGGRAVDIEDGNRGTFGRKRLADRLADAAAATGDNGHTALEIRVATPSRYPALVSVSRAWLLNWA